MKVKKIAFLHNDYPCGGCEKVTSDISEYLINNGREVFVFAKNIKPELFSTNDKNIRFASIYKSESNTPEFYQSLIERIEENEIDLLVLANSNLNISILKERCRCKIVYSSHGTPFWEAHSTVELKKKRSKKTFGRKLEWFFIHWIKYNIIKSHLTKTKKQYQKTLNEVDAYTVLCDDFKKDIVKKLKFEDLSSKIFVLNNPCSKPNQSLNLSKKNQVLYVGRLNYDDKRVDRLLMIWQKIQKNFNDWELKIVGDGDEREQLLQVVNTNNIKNVVFEGFHTDVTKFYQNASILCLTSNFEGWPLVLVESQVNGVVPISFNCSKGVETILSTLGSDNVLVSCYNLDEYCAKLSNLMTNTDLRETLQKRGLQVINKYNISAVGNQWEALFNDLESN